MPLLSIKNLSVILREDGSSKEIIKDLSLEVKENKVLALVGGSGSGKTITALSILGLLPEGMNITSGQILFLGQHLCGLPLAKRVLCKVRGKEISMIFQEPLSALNPVFSIQYQLYEVLRQHTNLSSRQRKERALDLLAMVGMPDPKRNIKNYSHELSGGMRQRAMIALALAGEPRLIIADEPTSNLDVTLQAHLIELFRKLKNEICASLLLITHDLGVVQELADEVAVLCQGELVEFNTKDMLFRNPRHPYTYELIKAVYV